jgi:hypothetical protein
MNAEAIRCCAASLLPLFLVAALDAAEYRDTPPPDPLTAAVAAGKVTLNLRARYENVSQTGLDDANAVTLRTRLGYTTGPLASFTASFEMENIAALDPDAYSQAGLNPDGAGQAVVADVPGTEVNQVWLAYTADDIAARAGRQRLVLDNARFIGDVAWRQNMQTFDALVLEGRAITHVALTYGYLDRINRVFGADHPQGVWNSDSHVLHAVYDGIKDVKLSGYAYLLDFSSSAANSCATYGVSVAGTRKLDAANLTWRLEYATQSDYGTNVTDYANAYLLAEAGVTSGQLTGTLGYEVLGTDNNVGFKTPLATLHAFNGWADVFLTTPAAGLRDLYGKAIWKLPHDVTATGFYHTFDTDTGVALGDEWDFQVAWKISKQFSAAVKYATFGADTPTLPDVDKFWLQAEFAF